MMDEQDRSDADGLRAISALGEPSRRALYDHIVDAGGWVSRDQAADATGLERATAAHHLDRLAADGLLDVEFRRISGRTGPGAGRPAKLYRRADRDFGVNLPPRNYRLAGELLARAVERSAREGTQITGALEAEARAQGRRWAEIVVARMRGMASRRPATRRDVVVDFLDEQGFEPATADEGTVTLRNCPFDYLAAEHTELICGMNHCLLEETVEHVGRTGLTATLQPSEDACCVKLVPK